MDGMHGLSALSSQHASLHGCVAAERYHGMGGMVQKSMTDHTARAPRHDRMGRRGYIRVHVPPERARAPTPWRHRGMRLLSPQATAFFFGRPIWNLNSVLEISRLPVVQKICICENERSKRATTTCDVYHLVSHAAGRENLECGTVPAKRAPAKISERRAQPAAERRRDGGRARVFCARHRCVLMLPVVYAPELARALRSALEEVHKLAEHVPRGRRPRARPCVRRRRRVRRRLWSARRYCRWRARAAWRVWAPRRSTGSRDGAPCVPLRAASDACGSRRPQPRARRRAASASRIREHALALRALERVRQAHARPHRARRKRACARGGIHVDEPRFEQPGGRAA